jgi:hypothetical protein
MVLCSEKNDAMAKITLPEDNARILARRYQMYLPAHRSPAPRRAGPRPRASRARPAGDRGTAEARSARTILM